MKALTVWAPWAHFLMAAPERPKRNETRSWPTSYRGPLAIHAAAREPGWVREGFAADERLRPLLDRLPAPWDHLARGAILGVADLVDVIPVAELVGLPETERLLGDYGPGRFAWITRNPRPLERPIPYRGSQGLWRLPPGVVPVAAGVGR